MLKLEISMGRVFLFQGRFNQSRLGQRKEPSNIDIQQLREMYKCEWDSRANIYSGFVLKNTLRIYV